MRLTENFEMGAGVGTSWRARSRDSKVPAVRLATAPSMEGASSSSSTRYYGVALALLAVAASAPSPALLRSLQKGGTHSAAGTNK